MNEQLWRGVEARGVMVILTGEGDKRVEWDSENWKSVIEASRTFQEMVQQGMMAVMITKRDDQGKVLELEQIREFSPETTDIIFRPPIAGG